MDISRFVETSPCKWELSHPPHAPVILYGTRELIEQMDEKVLEQANNVARLPGIVGASMAMPDAHWGYGFPIGGVAAFDPAEGGVISAGGVGFDISCGVRCLRTNLSAGEIAGNAALAAALFRSIPAGVGEEGKLKLSVSELDELLVRGAGWAVDRGFGTSEDLDYVEENGAIRDASPDAVSALAKRRQHGEMGTLGSGNHYLEVQSIEDVFDLRAAKAFGLAAGGSLVSIHCGSRGLGHQIGTEYLVEMARAAPGFGLQLPDRELACAPITSELGQRYLGAMRAGVNCALANRQILAHLTREAFVSVFPEARLETLFDVSHNTCKVEEHLIDNRPRTLYVHRKGATRSFGPGHPVLPARYMAVGQPVFIGGSMGTASYIMAGTAESELRSYSSASHGAGRAMSRHQALRRWKGRALVDELAAEGILIRTRSMRGIAEEAPGAYKDIHAVAEATERARLAQRVALLRPRICVKG